MIKNSNQYNKAFYFFQHLFYNKKEVNDNEQNIRKNSINSLSTVSITRIYKHIIISIKKI